MPQDPSSLPALLDAIESGDPTAHDALARFLYPRVRAIVHRELEQDFRVSNRWIIPLFSTGDVVSDVLARVVREVDHLEGGVESLSAFLATRVRHRVLDAMRFHGASKRGGRRSVDDRSPDDLAPGTSAGTPATLAEFAEQVAVFEDVVAQFPTRQQQLLVARLVDKESFPDIAEQLGYASGDSARKLFHEAHARLLLGLRARGVKPPGETCV